MSLKLVFQRDLLEKTHISWVFGLYSSLLGVFVEIISD